MTRSPFLARLVTSSRRAFLGLAGAFFGMAASICCFCSGVSGGCCPQTSEAQRAAPESARKNRFVMCCDLSFRTVRSRRAAAALASAATSASLSDARASPSDSRTGNRGSSARTARFSSTCFARLMASTSILAESRGGRAGAGSPINWIAPRSAST